MTAYNDLVFSPFSGTRGAAGGLMPAMNRITDALATNVAAKPADGELLSRFLASRDDPAFAEVVTRHGPMVYGVCLRRLGRTQDAEDCFQAVFLALATHGPKLVDRQTVGPWLYTVARQAAAKVLRSRGRRRWVFWGRTPEPAARTAVEVDVELDAALASLSEPERSAVVLCHLEGLSRSEAAKALAIPEGTLSARLARALEKLRRKLGRQPLAVLAAATSVILPDALPASTVGLVHHLRDGALEDWASPRVLDLYRKALPMRLLDRFGPAFAALAAAVLIMFGAAAGWQLVKGQPPGEGKQTQAATSPQVSGKKKSFAGAIDEAQRRSAPEGAGNQSTSAVVQITVAGRAQSDARGTRTYWDIRVSEVIDGESIEHRMAAWPAIQPLLKQIAEGGVKAISAKVLPDPVTRLEANQLINDCKRAGFTHVDYNGPALFLGREDDSWKASAHDVSTVNLNIDLAKSGGFLPDWTNGWIVYEDKFFQVGTDRPAANQVLEKVLMDSGGASGPAAEFVETLAKQARMEPATLSTAKAASATELAKQIDAQQRHDRSAQMTITLTSINDRTEFGLLQQFARGWATTSASKPGVFRRLVARTARYAGGRVEIRSGEVERRSNQGPGARFPFVNPLHINGVLNACRSSNIAEVHYWGQKIFTGAESPFSFAPYTGQEGALPIVNLILSLKDLEGDLPDESNGWTYVQGNSRCHVVREADRERLMESLRPKNEAVTYDAEVVRLARLPLDAFEHELAKKPRLLQNRFRQAVEEAKKSSPPAPAKPEPSNSDRKSTTYSLQNSDAAGVAEALKSTPAGKASEVSISVDRRMNAVVVSAPPDKQAALAKVLASRDAVEPANKEWKHYVYHLNKSKAVDVVNALRSSGLGRTGDMTFAADQVNNEVSYMVDSSVSPAKLEGLRKTIQSLDELGTK